MKIYLAGPMRGHEQFNHPAFAAATGLLRNAGHEVFSPAEEDRASSAVDWARTTGDLTELGELFDLREALGRCLGWICGHADAVVLLPDWGKSLGARAEASTALALDVPVWELAPFLLYGASSPWRIDRLP